MVSHTFVLKLFEAFSIERWTDLARPVPFIEMDKAAEKMALAYIIGKFEENKGNCIDWDWIIYSSLFDICKKIALCDIKSPVQRMIKSEYPDEYNKLNEWVVEQFKPFFKDLSLFNRFKNYVMRDIPPLKDQSLTERVLGAAHKYSAFREFEMLSVINESYRLESISTQLHKDLQSYLDIEGLQLLLMKQRPYKFLMVFEQLRFQNRWNQTPRVPKTSVLGHCFFVALLTLILSHQSDIKMCTKRLYNNFFSALFHDLPEAVTRDIISPVKQATDGLPSIVKKIEDEVIEAELKPLMEAFFSTELDYFTSDEFENRIVIENANGKMPIGGISFEDLNNQYNRDTFSPIDGKLVRCADHIAAFVEADCSIKHGITSEHLIEGRTNIISLYPKGLCINGFSPFYFFSKFSI